MTRELLWDHFIVQIHGKLVCTLYYCVPNKNDDKTVFLLCMFHLNNYDFAQRIIIVKCRNYFIKNTKRNYKSKAILPISVYAYALRIK